MKIKTRINHYKKQLIQKAIKKGLYENFGQNEVSKLNSEFIDISKYTDEMNEKRELITEFDEWCMNFNDKQLKREILEEK